MSVAKAANPCIDFSKSWYAIGMQIIILGAGYAGLRTALDLDQMLRERGRDDKVVLVDQFSYHQIVQILHLTATDRSPQEKAIYELAPLLRKTSVEFVQGHVKLVVPDQHEVQFDDGRVLTYDRLVLALGAETDFRDVPGAREHTLPLRTYQHAVRLRDHLIAQFEAAARTDDPVEQRILLTTAVVGGGYTGCQLSGELAGWVSELCQRTGAPRGQARIALLHRNPRLLEHFERSSSLEAARVLDQLGVSIYLDTSVTSVEPRLLRVNDGRILRAATLVWAGGIRAPALLANSGFVVDEIGRVLVDRYMRVHDQALVFAMGDCAAIPDGSGSVVPSTASYAMRQGEHMAETLLAEVMGRAPRSYEPLKLGELVSLGPKDAVGSPLGLPARGYPLILLKKGIEQYYRASIESASL